MLGLGLSLFILGNLIFFYWWLAIRSHKEHTIDVCKQRAAMYRDKESFALSEARRLNKLAQETPNLSSRFAIACRASQFFTEAREAGQIAQIWEDDSNEDE